LQPSYAIDTLYVFFVGDILDNHFIYKGQQFFVDNDVGKQIWIAVKAFQEVLTAFLTKFKKVVVIGIPGNHGRMTPQIEEHFTTSTWDYQLLKILDVCFQNEKRIEFIVPESWFYVAKIKGWKYLLHHGNSVYSWMCVDDQTECLTYDGWKRYNDLTIGELILTYNQDTDTLEYQPIEKINITPDYQGEMIQLKSKCLIVL